MFVARIFTKQENGVTLDATNWWMGPKKVVPVHKEILLSLKENMKLKSVQENAWDWKILW